MIALLIGEVKELSAPSAVILTSAGVGYEVELPLSSFCELSVGASVSLWTHLVVREDAQLLCGFIHKSDRDAFRKLIKITGVGVKMALAMLSVMSAKELADSVQSDDDKALTAISGVGKKTAQRLIIELKDKLTDLGTKSQADILPSDHNEMQVIAEVESALAALGYKDKEIQNAIRLAKTVDTAGTVSGLLRASLRQLSL